MAPMAPWIIVSPNILKCVVCLSIGRQTIHGVYIMNNSVFIETEFFLLIIFSLVLPIGIYSTMMLKKAISRVTILLFGISLIFISGVSVVLLQRLATMAKLSPSLLDDRFFASEISAALYLVPALFAGIGINIISNILVNHLASAARQHDQDSDDKKRFEL